MEWQFEMGSKVSLISSNESGEVIGRAQYQNGENYYQIRYRAGDGRQVEAWWGESALVAG